MINKLNKEKNLKKLSNHSCEASRSMKTGLQGGTRLKLKLLNAIGNIPLEFQYI